MRTQFKTGIALSCLLALSGAAQAQETIKLGLTAALTGPFNEFGEGVRRGAEIAIEEANKAGGINGKKVELGEALDDQLVPDRAVQNMRRILDNKDIVGLIAPSGSGPVLAVIDMVQADGRPMCNTQAQTPAVTYPNGRDKPPRPNIFSVSVANDVEADKFGKALGGSYKKLGILHESTAYGVTGADLIKKSLIETNKAIEVTLESYNQRAQDMTAQLVKIQKAGAEALLVVGLGADFAAIHKNMTRLNINIQLFGTAGALTQPYIEGAGDLAVGTRGVSLLSLGERPMQPEVQKFADLYRAKHGTDRWYGPDAANPQVAIGSTVATGYDCARLLIDAIKRAGSTKPDAIIKALNETKDFPGVVVTSITFTPAKHTAAEPQHLGIYEMVKKDGRMLLQLAK